MENYSIKGKENYDYLLKFIIIGDAGAGKSCILHQFVEGKFRKNANHTVGVEFGSKIINILEKNIKLQIWDTAGQERYRSVTRSYYRGAAGCLLVYDITKESFEHLLNWLSDARALSRSEICIVIVGNKTDLQYKRAVTFLEASQFAQENGALFMETSAFTGDGVLDAFASVTKIILGKINDGIIDASAISGGIGASGGRQLEDEEKSKASMCSC